MDNAKIYLFTSPTCPHCPAAKQFMQRFKNERDDADFFEYSTATSDGVRMAQKFDVMSVPTFIIKGPAIDYNIGLNGVQPHNTMHKYIDIALGKRALEEKQKKPFELKLGKLKIKF